MATPSLFILNYVPFMAYTRLILHVDVALLAKSVVQQIYQHSHKQQATNT